MKYLVLLLVLVVAIGLLRAGKRRRQPPAAPPPPLAGPQAMVRCAHCGVHLPQTDAIAGPGGPFCSAEHQRASRLQ